MRSAGLRGDGDPAAAGEFYRANQSRMDAGAVVGWPARKNPDELSAIQHAMNLKLRDEAAFYSEYQNEPLPPERLDHEMLTPLMLPARVSGFPRGVVPADCAHLTMFVDVQEKALFWLVAGWKLDFSGYIVDYGTEPDQKSDYFMLRQIRRTLASVTRSPGVEGALCCGLQRLAATLITRAWPTSGDGTMSIERCLIDANRGASTELVYQFCRESGLASIVMPSLGRYVGAASKPFAE